MGAENIEDTYDELISSWWGAPESLHLDAWGILDYVDGYEIKLEKVPPEEQREKLYFVNLGGYDQNEFTELHKNIFVVAPTPSKAKVKALEQILHWQSHHRDYQYKVDQMINVGRVLTNKEHFIHLTPVSEAKPFVFTCKYVPLGKTDGRQAL